METANGDQIDPQQVGSTELDALKQKKDVLDYAESAGQANMKFHIDNRDSISKESNTTLTILLAGAGTSLGYWIKLLELKNHPYLSWGTMCVSIYLFLVSLVLIVRSMQIADIEAPANEPKNLYQPQFPVDAVREVELEQLQIRIDANRIHNEKTSHVVNSIRIAAVLTPVVFFVGSLLGIVYEMLAAFWNA